MLTEISNGDHKESPIVTAAAGGHRRPYDYSDLVRLIRPRSIAIIGASTRTGSFGLRTLKNLAGFQGTLFPVNAKYESIEGHRCYPSIASVPEKVDCAVIALARELVEEAVADCVKAGVGGVIIYASGFAETGRADLIALQQRLVNLVTGTQTRLMGPNCLGITNYAIGARILFGRMPPPEPLGRAAIGIVAQSGSVAMSLGQAVERGVSISHSLPVGNACDVGVADLVSYLAHDDTCKAIACVFEGVNDPAQLTEAARIASDAEKPLIIYKMAVGAEGAAAALSHTGALAGSHEAYKMALKSAGAIIVDNIEDVIETAVFFAKAGRPTGKGAGVVLGSGGLGVIAADKAEEHGVPLPQPSGKTLDVLKANVPEFGAPRNPCDVTAQALNDERPLAACASAMLKDPIYSALVVVQPYADEISSARVPLWARLAAEHGKIICNYWATESLVGHGAREVEAEPHIATFRSLNRCFTALAAWHDRETRRTRVDHAVRIVSEPNRKEAGRLLADARERALTEREAKKVLSLYGLNVVREQLASSPSEAARIAQAFGFPVAIKVESPDILHKTEAGVVRLNLRSVADVEASANEILEKAKVLRPSPKINGVLVQSMARPGIEMMVGGRIDPQFGPLVVVGLGGIMVELVKDTALAVAPISPIQARELLGQLKSRSALSGFRGIPAVDLDQLSNTIARFSEFLADHEACLKEVDVNPLICSGSAIVSVDALIVTRAPEGPGKRI